MRMLIMGAPGSGKGTQSESLSKKLNIPAISTGAMLRDAVANGTETGKAAQEYISQGKLVPDDVMIGIVLQRLGMKDCERGYILDGFPRTLAQAEAMDKAGIITDVAIFMDASDQVIMKRLSGRRVCPKCGATYHITSMPSAKGDKCQVCESPLAIRDDDKPETIEKRLSVYRQQTAPVIEYYRQKNKLLTVNADDEVENITAFVTNVFLEKEE